jgi:hypothetical protein
MNDETRCNSSAKPSNPAKDLSVTHGWGICHLDIPSSFGYRHSSSHMSSLPVENIHEAGLMSQLFTYPTFNLT